jgi:crossover junction endodeoxyribonuclease RusA
MLKVELPWPSRNLRPNARTHWAVRARETKSHRRTAYFLTMVETRERPASSWPARIPIRLTFHPPLRRAHDRDNLIANCKAYLDGAADALDVNDNRFDIMPPQILEVVKRGKVILEIGE